MNYSDIIALAALLLSAIAIWQSRSAQASQERLTTREIELVRQQLEHLKRDERLWKTADVSARLYKVGKNDWRLRVFNKGPALAENVMVKILETEKSLFSEDWIKQKMPMSRMEKGDSVDIHAFVHMQSNLKENLELVWDDPSESNRRKTVEVSI